jgi:hypothetical protein
MLELLEIRVLGSGENIIVLGFFSIIKSSFLSASHYGFVGGVFPKIPPVTIIPIPFQQLPPIMGW